MMPFGVFEVETFSFDMTRVVAERLQAFGLHVVPQKDLEDFLAKRRIRRTDFLDRPAVRAIGTALHADALIMGTVSVLRGGENPHVSMNAQMVDCIDASVIWANSISRMGSDYAGFLGIGKITSLEKLVGVVVEELFENLPRKVNLRSDSATPFEIIRAGFFPDALRSGEMSRLSMEVKEMTGKVRDIKAFVLEYEIPLKTNDGRMYSGVIAAPVIEGSYPLTIYVTDRWNRLFILEAVTGLTVDNTPPEIALVPRQRVISPDNDTFNDYVLFVPEISKAFNLRSWRIEITDEAGEIVRSEEGFGALPEGFVWRGVDSQYEIVKDGTYFCRLIVEDEAGNKTTTPAEKVVVDLTPPEVIVGIGQQETEEDVVLALKTKENSQIDYWEIIIHNMAGKEEGRFEGTGDLPDTIMTALKKKKINRI
jgi:hypothetical protein